jgi:hypothetical protein
MIVITIVMDYVFACVRAFSSDHPTPRRRERPGMRKR